MSRIFAIVEGDGEVEAVPVLVRRIGSEVSPLTPPDVFRPIRVRRQQVLKEGELERYVNLGALRVGDGGCILILLDANGDCPAELGPTILHRARAARPERGAWWTAATGRDATVIETCSRGRCMCGAGRFYG